MKHVLYLFLLLALIQFSSCTRKSPTGTINVTFDTSTLSKLKEATARAYMRSMAKKTVNGHTVSANALDTSGLAAATDFHYVVLNVSSADTVLGKDVLAHQDSGDHKVTETSTTIKVESGDNRVVTVLAVLAVESSSDVFGPTNFYYFTGKSSVFTLNADETKNVPVYINTSSAVEVYVLPTLTRVYMPDGSVAANRAVSFRFTLNNILFEIPVGKDENGDGTLTTDSNGILEGFGIFKDASAFSTVDVIVDGQTIVSGLRFSSNNGTNYGTEFISITMGSSTTVEIAVQYLGKALPSGWSNLDDDGDGSTNYAEISRGDNPWGEGSFDDGGSGSSRPGEDYTGTFNFGTYETHYERYDWETNYSVHQHFYVPANDLTLGTPVNIYCRNVSWTAPSGCSLDSSDFSACAGSGGKITATGCRNDENTNERGFTIDNIPDCAINSNIQVDIATNSAFSNVTTMTIHANLRTTPCETSPSNSEWYSGSDTSYTQVYISNNNYSSWSPSYSTRHYSEGSGACLWTCSSGYVVNSDKSGCESQYCSLAGSFTTSEEVNFGSWSTAYGGTFWNNDMYLGGGTNIESLEKWLIRKSTDKGASFSNVNYYNPGGSAFVKDIAVSGSTLYATGESLNYWNVMKSTDGTNWTIDDSYQLAGGNPSKPSEIVPWGSGLCIVGTGMNCTNMGEMVTRCRGDGAWITNDNYVVQESFHTYGLGGASSNSYLYVAGYGEQSTSGNLWTIRRYDGSSWDTKTYQYASSYGSYARDVEYYNGSIYAAGNVTDSSGNIWWYVRRISESDWSSDSWTELDKFQQSGLKTVAEKIHITPNGDIFVGGYVEKTGPKLNIIIRKSSDGGSTWSTLEYLDSATVDSRLYDIFSDITNGGTGVVYAGFKDNSWLVRQLSCE